MYRYDKHLCRKLLSFDAIKTFQNPFYLIYAHISLSPAACNLHFKTNDLNQKLLTIILERKCV